MATMALLAFATPHPAHANGSLTLGGPDNVLVGSPSTLTLTFIGDNSSSELFTIGWGDGTFFSTPDTGLPTTGNLTVFSFSHDYAAGTWGGYVLWGGETHTFTATVTSPTAQAPFIVIDPAPAGPDCPKGQYDGALSSCFLQLGVDTYTLTGTITDSSSNLWTVTIDWKDPASSLAGCINYNQSNPVSEVVTRPPNTDPSLAVAFSFSHVYCVSSKLNFIRPTVNAYNPTTPQLFTSTDMPSTPTPGLLIEDTIPPTLNLTPPTSLVVEATSPDGAPLPGFTANATDNDPAAIAVCVVYSGPAPLQSGDTVYGGEGGSVIPLGTTVVNCQAKDTTGNLSPIGAFSVTVVDTTPPALTLPGNITTEATGPDGAAVSFTATATDIVDVTDPVTCGPASGSTFPIGTTTVACGTTDMNKNAASGSFTVTVVDTTAPTLSLPAAIVTSATSSGGAIVSYTATATDLVDGSVEISCVPASPATFPLGTTTVNCSASDNSHNTVSDSFTVTVNDVVILSGIPTPLPIEATGPSGAAFTYTSPTATDLVAGGSTPVACSPTSGATFALGTTTVSCTATDANGNTATASFTVAVQDRTPPVLPALASFTKTTASLSGMAVSWPAITATDLVDGAITASCSPAAGSNFVVGTTAVTCMATDSHGNKASASFNVTVSYVAPPVVTVPGDITVTANAGATDAVIIYSPAPSAVDSSDPSIPVACTPPSGSSFSIGTTPVTCTATDSYGNSSSASFNVIVKPFDNVPPAITVPEKIVVYTGNPAGAAITYAPPTATDNVDSTPKLICTSSPIAGLASGSTFPIGITTTNCTASDASGNVSTASFTINVNLVTASFCKKDGGWKLLTNPSFKNQGDCVSYFATDAKNPPDQDGNDSSNSDSHPPKIKVPGNITVHTTDPSGVVVNYQVTASDDSGQAVTIVCTPPSSSVFAVGKTTVTCSGTDTAGNVGIESFTVTVVLDKQQDASKPDDKGDKSDRH